MHVPAAHRGHGVGDAGEQPYRLLAHVVVAQARTLDHRAGDHVFVRPIAARDRQRLPRAALAVLGPAGGVALRRRQHRGRSQPGNAAAQVEQDQPDCPADGGVGAETRPEAAVAAVQADLRRIRAVDDHQRCDAVHRALHAVHVERLLQDQRQTAQHHRQVLGTAAGHHRMQRDIAHGRDIHRRRYRPDHLGCIAPRAGEHPVEACLRRRHHRQAVAPRLVEEELERIERRRCAHCAVSFAALTTLV